MRKVSSATPMPISSIFVFSSMIIFCFAIFRASPKKSFIYSFLSETEFRKLKDLSKFLNKKEIEILKEIASIMREKNPVWGV